VREHRFLTPPGIASLEKMTGTRGVVDPEEGRLIRGVTEDVPIESPVSVYVNLFEAMCRRDCHLFVISLSFYVHLELLHSQSLTARPEDRRDKYQIWRTIYE